MSDFQEQYKNQIKALADSMRNQDMPSLTEELFAMFESTGNRLKYENVYFTRRKFLAVFGIAAVVFKRQEDLEKLEEVLQELCAEECWALPVHVNRKDNPEWRFTVDLFAAETAQALAEIVALVGEEQKEFGLTIETCQKVRSEIERRVLVPFEQTVQGWECSDHNWNAVCCGGIGSAAIYLLAGKEEHRLKPMLQRICHSLTFYLNGFREDGACMEGIGYFTYGMTYFTGFAEQLLRYSNGKINLFNNDKIRRIAEFQQKMYFGCGQTVSFSDGEESAKFRMGLTCFLAKQYETVRIPNRKFAAGFETDPCYRFMGLIRDVLWTADAEYEKNVDTAKEAELSEGNVRHDILPLAQWSICESKNGIGFAIKGGNNNEPHNHNDVGSFLYLAEGEQVLCDLGAGEYTAEYFGAGRYGILCNSSEGHSVPIINGEFQQAGVQHRASFFEADGKGKTIIEFSGAYQDGLAEKLTRETKFDMEDGRLEVTDKVAIPLQKAKEGTIQFTENLVTKGIVLLQEDSVQIQGKQCFCQIQIEGKAEHLRVLEKEHFNHEGKRETVRLIQWDVMPEQGEKEWEKGELCYGVSKYFIRCR